MTPVIAPRSGGLAEPALRNAPGMWRVRPAASGPAVMGRQGISLTSLLQLCIYGAPAVPKLLRIQRNTPPSTPILQMRNLRLSALPAGQWQSPDVSLGLLSVGGGHALPHSTSPGERPGASNKGPLFPYEHARDMARLSSRHRDSWDRHAGNLPGAALLVGGTLGESAPSPENSTFSNAYREAGRGPPT